MKGYIQVAPTQAAMIEAYVKFKGRDWRRIKREVNKAIKRVKRETRAK